MTLLPLSTFIFSLLAGNIDMGQPSSDVKKDIVSRYKGLQIEEPQENEAEETGEQDEEASQSCLFQKSLIEIVLNFDKDFWGRSLVDADLEFGILTNKRACRV